MVASSTRRQKVTKIAFPVYHFSLSIRGKQQRKEHRPNEETCGQCDQSKPPVIQNKQFCVQSQDVKSPRGLFDDSVSILLWTREKGRKLKALCILFWTRRKRKRKRAESSYKTIPHSTRPHFLNLELRVTHYEEAMPLHGTTLILIDGYDVGKQEKSHGKQAGINRLKENFRLLGESIRKPYQLHLQDFSILSLD